MDLAKYSGSWCELMHYPSSLLWTDNYNTTVDYTPVGNDTMKVHNSTIRNGERYESEAEAKWTSPTTMSVTYASTPAVTENYVLDREFLDNEGKCMFLVFTNGARNALYVYSRQKHPSVEYYNELMRYVTGKFDRNKLAQTPHFEAKCGDKCQTKCPSKCPTKRC